MSQAGITSVDDILGLPLDVSQGGTGDVAFTPYAVITGGTTPTGALQNVVGVGTLGQVLTSGGAATLPTWTTISSGVSSVSGTLDRITSTGGANPVIDIAATYVGQSSITTLGTITTGVWQGTAIGPTFGGTGQTTYATGDVLYASAANTLAKLPAGSDTQVLTLAAGIPSWATPTTGTVTSVSGTANRITSTGGSTPVIDIDASYIGQSSITTLGTIATGVWNGTAIGPTFGGTGQTTYATGDILYASAANTLSKLAAGSDTEVLTLAAGVPTWAAPAVSGITTVTGQLFTASGAFTYTPTAGMEFVIVELIGGGAGGGGANGNALSGCGGGGGSGGYARFILTAAQVGASLSGSVGALGAGGAAGNNAGTGGGNTTLATTAAWTVAGGAGGASTAGAGTTTVAGGAGGTVTTGTGTILATSSGGSGGMGSGFSAAGACGGAGGSNVIGNGGPASYVMGVQLSAGFAGIGYGSGGGGASCVGAGDRAGGAGIAGAAIFTEFV